MDLEEKEKCLRVLFFSAFYTPDASDGEDEEVDEYGDQSVVELKFYPTDVEKGMTSNSSSDSLQWHNKM